LKNQQINEQIVEPRDQVNNHHQHEADLQREQAKV
jgi:hypothetical protein